MAFLRTKSLSLLFTALLSFSTLFTISDARKFEVGGTGAWVPNPPENYASWAGKSRFLVHDTLYFSYAKGADSVLEVNKADYDACNTKNPIKKVDDGDSEISLDRSGPFYFISGNEDNCKKGQKLNVVVLSVRTPAPPPQAAAPVNSPPGAMSPKSSSPVSPATSPPAPMPPKSSSPVSPSSAPVTSPPAPTPPKSSSPVSPSSAPVTSPPGSMSPKSSSPVSPSSAPVTSPPGSMSPKSSSPVSPMTSPPAPQPPKSSSPSSAPGSSPPGSMAPKSSSVLSPSSAPGQSPSSVSSSPPEMMGPSGDAPSGSAMGPSGSAMGPSGSAMGPSGGPSTSGDINTPAGAPGEEKKSSANGMAVMSVTTVLSLALTIFMSA